MDGDGLRLNMNGLDYLILALYFVTVLGVGFAARRASGPASTSSSPAARCRPG